MKALFEELRRRNVLRAGAAYLVSAWLIAQVADLLTDAYDAPGWVMRAVLGVLGLGFPAAVLLAWAYEFTPRGLERDADVPLDSPTRVRTGRRLDRAIIALLTIALLYFAIDKIWLSAPPPPTTSVEPTLAVLPFDNIGGDSSNEVLADGIPETLLTMLTQVPAMRVIGRTSSFSFKGQGIDPVSIGQQLGASVVLMGSVQRAGERLRISASLISSADGAQLWAEKFDGSVDDVFAMQDEVALRVVEASKVTLTGGGGPGTVGTHNFAAYELQLRAEALVTRRDTDAVAEGIRLLEPATTPDPNPTDAWVSLAYAHLIDPAGQDLAAALQAAQKAVTIAPEYGYSHLILSVVLRSRGDPGADAELDRARTLAPQDPIVMVTYASRLRLVDGQYEEAADILRRLVAQDPRNAYIRQQAAFAFDTVGDVSGALVQLREAIRLNPHSAFNHGLVANILAGAVGQRDESLRYYRKALELDPARDDVRAELSRGYAALGADDLARRELTEARTRLSATEYLWLRADLESLWGERAAAEELLAHPFTREDFDSYGLPGKFARLTIARTRDQAAAIVANFDRVAPTWYDEALVDERAAPICLLELSGDHERATALLKALEPDWRKRVAYAPFTGAAGRGDALARALACTGRSDDAITELETLIEQGYPAGGWRRLTTHPAYASIRHEPRFEAIVARLHTIADEERTRFLARPDLQPSDLDALGEPAS